MIQCEDKSGPIPVIISPSFQYPRYINIVWKGISIFPSESIAITPPRPPNGATISSIFLHAFSRDSPRRKSCCNLMCSTGSDEGFTNSCTRYCDLLISPSSCSNNRRISNSAIGLSCHTTSTGRSG